MRGREWEGDLRDLRNLVGVFASRKNLEVEVKVLGRKTLNTMLGRRDTLVVEPLATFESVFYRKGRAIVWVTDDVERIPALVKSEIAFGSFTATLTRRDVGGFQANLRATGRPGR